MDELKAMGHVPLSFHREPESAPFQPYVAGELSTPSGKVEFYSETLAALGLDPLPAFVPPAESRWGTEAGRFPLELLGRKNDNYMNSTFANHAGHRKMEARKAGMLEMHPVDAAARGIADGDRVRIFNGRGELRLSALLTDTLPTGVIACRLDWAKFHPDAVNVNALTSERLTDIGAAPTFYSVLVEVEKDSA